MVHLLVGGRVHVLERAHLDEQVEHALGRLRREVGGDFRGEKSCPPRVGVNRDRLVAAQEEELLARARHVAEGGAE